MKRAAKVVVPDNATALTSSPPRQGPRFYAVELLEFGAVDDAIVFLHVSEFTSKRYFLYQVSIYSFISRAIQLLHALVRVGRNWTWSKGPQHSGPAGVSQSEVLEALS